MVWQYGSIGSDNGLTPTIWTNDGLFTDAYVSLSINELTELGFFWIIK